MKTGDDESMLPGIFLIFASFSIFIYYVYIAIHKWTYFKYYNLEKFRRNHIAAVSFCFLLSFLNVGFGSYLHSNAESEWEEIEALLCAAAGLNFFIAIVLLAATNRMKEMISRQKMITPLRENLIEKVDREIWRDCARYFDMIMLDEMEFDFEEFFPFIGIEKYYQMGGSSVIVHRPGYIRYHPYYQQFKKEVNDIELEEILKRLDTPAGNHKS